MRLISNRVKTRALIFLIAR